MKAWTPRRGATRIEAAQRGAAARRREAAGRRPAQVGWLFRDPKGSVIFSRPVRVKTQAPSAVHAKSAARCPAIHNMESRYFVIRCPFDLRLRVERDGAGRVVLRNLNGAMGGARGSALSKMLHLVKEKEWRHPDRPTLQVSLPYVFISDEPVYMTQLDAFQHYRPQALPGTIFGGRFPIDVWPRGLLWAFEWWDMSRELSLKRGDPWFYVTFEADMPDRPIQLVEAERTAALEAYLRGLEGVVNYVDQTFSLFAEARARRPAKLLIPRKKGAA